MIKKYCLIKKQNGEILNIYVNKNGYVSIISTDATYKSIITLYDSYGKQILKKYLASTRIVDLAISDDNQYIAFAEIDTAGTTIKSSVKVISIEKANISPEEAIINSFENDNSKMIINIKYQEKDNLTCEYDDAVDIINKEDRQKLLDIDDKITFISGNLKNSICYIEEEKNGIFDSNSKLNIVNTQNGQNYLYYFEEVVKEMYSKDNVIGINVGTEIYFINANGMLIKKYVSKQEITNVMLSNNIAIVIYKDRIEIVSF